MPLLSRSLAAHRIDLALDGAYDFYSGDLSVPGRGELLVLA